MLTSRSPRRSPATCGDEVKIDRTFISTIEWSEGDQVIVQAMIRFGHDLGLVIVAEGVETQGTPTLPTQWGIDIAQGYYFGRPACANDMTTRLTRPALTLVPPPPPETRLAARAH